MQRSYNKLKGLEAKGQNAFCKSNVVFPTCSSCWLSPLPPLQNVFTNSMLTTQAPYQSLEEGK
eukprot:1550014-Prorocentrum_lima.AAC.1